uniref:Uncharacterized protein n=1 Tax=Lygus hesperus TaxID=30085 RepID=A0A146KSH2_LYGHE
MLYTVLTCVLQRLGITTMFALVLFLVCNLGLPPEEGAPLFELSVIVAVTSFACYFVVLLVCSVTHSLQTNSFVLFTVYVLNLMSAGLVLNLTTLPKVLQLLSFGSILRLSYESCILTQFTNRLFGCDVMNHNSDNNTSSYTEEDSPMTCYTGDEYAAFLGF